VSEGAVRQLLHRARATLRTAATAITPLPFVSWLAATRPAPAAAILATAGVVASGSVAVKHHHARYARVGHAKHLRVPVHRAEALVTRAAPVSRQRVTHSAGEVVERGSKDSQPEHRSHGSRKTGGRDEQEPLQRSEQSRPAENGQDEQQDRSHSRHEGDSEYSGSDSGEGGD
jgi:hypothetical protein